MQRAIRVVRSRANEYGSRLSTHYGQTPNVHYFLGTLHNFQSDYAGAEIEFKHELQISPKHAAAMLALARLAMDDDRQKESEALAKSASELDPKNPETHSLYGEILLKAGNADNSARELEIAKKLAPDSASIRFQLAAAYRRLHRAADADRETAAFNLLKDKQLVMASAEEKLKSRPELLK